MGLVLKNVSTRNLKDISFEVARGEILALYGPDAEVRAELFRAVTGGIPVTSGEILLDGKKLDRETVFEDYVIYKRRMRKWLYFLYYRRWLATVDEKKLNIVTKVMNIERGLLVSRAPGHLSKGERKKFDLARYLITARGIVLLEDPLSGLDPAMQKAIIKNLKDIIPQFQQPCLYNAGTAMECEELNCRVALIKKGGLYPG